LLGGDHGGKVRYVQVHSKASGNKSQPPKPAILAEPHPNLKSATLETFHAKPRLFGAVLHAASSELFIKMTE
jgi:hypothetical protein